MGADPRRHRCPHGPPPGCHRGLLGTRRGEPGQGLSWGQLGGDNLRRVVSSWIRSGWHWGAPSPLPAPKKRVWSPPPFLLLSQLEEIGLGTPPPKVLRHQSCPGAGGGPPASLPLVSLFPKGSGRASGRNLGKPEVGGKASGRLAPRGGASRPRNRNRGGGGGAGEGSGLAHNARHSPWVTSRRSSAAGACGEREKILQEDGRRASGPPCPSVRAAVCPSVCPCCCPSVRPSMHLPAPLLSPFHAAGRDLAQHAATGLGAVPGGWEQCQEGVWGCWGVWGGPHPAPDPLPGGRHGHGPPAPEGLCHLLGRVLRRLADLLADGADRLFLRRAGVRVIFGGTEALRKNWGLLRVFPHPSPPHCALPARPPGWGGCRAHGGPVPRRPPCTVRPVWMGTP